LVTVTTVGYGDFFPVTSGGRITAGFIMVTGLLTLGRHHRSGRVQLRRPSAQPGPPQPALGAGHTARNAGRTRPAARPDRKAAHCRHVSIRTTGWRVRARRYRRAMTMANAAGQGLTVPTRSNRPGPRGSRKDPRGRPQPASRPRHRPRPGGFGHGNGLVESRGYWPSVHPLRVAYPWLIAARMIRTDMCRLLLHG
jgi:Ion channel